jgi:hypothetical protein
VNLIAFFTHQRVTPSIELGVRYLRYNTSREVLTAMGAAFIDTVRVPSNNESTTLPSSNLSLSFNGEETSSSVPSSTYSEVAGERALLDHMNQIQGQHWFTRHYQGGHQATALPPGLCDRYTVTWPTLQEPIEFVPILEQALSSHSPDCPFRRQRYIVHSDDRNSHPISPHCGACKASILVEDQFNYFLRLTPQAGGHLLSIYDQWKVPWYQTQVIPANQTFVKQGMKFVVRCIESIMQKTGVIDPRKNISPPPPGLSRSGSRGNRNGVSRI